MFISLETLQKDVVVNYNRIYRWFFFKCYVIFLFQTYFITELIDWHFYFVIISILKNKLSIMT